MTDTKSHDLEALAVRPAVYNVHRKDAPKGSIYVGRGSPWGNPFLIGRDGDRAQVIERFRCEVLPSLNVEQLIGKSLICFCAPLSCHADLLLEAAALRARATGAA